MPHHHLLKAALGQEKADLLITNCRLVNVLSGEIHPANVAIKDGIVLGFEEYDAVEIVDAGGKYLCPGLVEGHIHIESTLLHPVEFAKVTATHGTAVVVCDPHELANVEGTTGIEWLLDVTKDLSLEIYCMMPSCVPATHLETSGAMITAQDISSMLARHQGRILGLAEMMNYPGVLARDPEVLEKVLAVGELPVDGHCPDLSGLDLNTYILAGPGSEHESFELANAREKLRKGMHLMIREGSSAKNLQALLPVVNGFNSQNCSLVTDDRHCDDLVRDGHLDHAVRMAIAQGMHPVRAIQMASINTARYFRLRHRGAIAPGYRADFVLLDHLESFGITDVYLAGQHMDALTWAPGSTTHTMENSVRVPDLLPHCLDIPEEPGKMVRVMSIMPGQIITEQALVKPKVVQALVQADPDNDVAKVAVFERHHGTGTSHLGLVRGLGLRAGALASTVAHDAHNLIVVGIDDQDMLLAVETLKECGGGHVCVRDGQVVELVPLPLAGLMSDWSAQEVVDALDRLNTAAWDLGCPAYINPFMQLSFLSLPVIPRLRLTDKGLVDVRRFDFVSLFDE